MQVITARGLIGNGIVKTTTLGAAGIVGADVAIITVKFPAGETPTIRAKIAICAGISIVADHRIVRESTSRIRVTGIVGTELFVVADYGDAAPASTVGTKLVGSTRVSVIADHRIIEMEAPLVKVAQVIGANVVVIASYRLSGTTHSILADVVHGATAAIIAGLFIGNELATGRRPTGIIRARVTVIACQIARTDTLAQVTVVPQGANVAIVAGNSVEQMHTALAGVA